MILDKHGKIIIENGKIKCKESNEGGDLCFVVGNKKMWDEIRTLDEEWEDLVKQMADTVKKKK